MARPIELSLLKIALHESSVSSFLNEIPKYPYFKIRDLSESESGAFYQKMFHEKSILSADIEMLNHKINEIEENLIYLFQKLRIDPDDVSIPPSNEKYEMKVENVEELVDILHEQTENESRRIRGYFESIESYEEELEYSTILKNSLKWMNENYHPTLDKLRVFKHYLFKIYYEKIN